MNMKKRVAIKASSLPPRPPIGFAILYWLLLDRLNAADWAYGVMWTIVALFALAYVVDFARTSERDVPGFGERE